VIVAKFFHFLSSIACARASANPFLLQSNFLKNVSGNIFLILNTKQKIYVLIYRGRVSHATNSHPHRGSKTLFSDELSQTWVRFARAHRVPHLGKPFVTGRWNTSSSVESVGVSPHKVPAGLCSSEPSSHLNKQLA